MSTSVPTLEEVATRLSKSEDAVNDAYEAERADQANRCRIDPYAVPLAEALHRRVARNLAMRNVPLGVVMDEAGGTRIGSADPEVRRLEGAYRRVVIG